jgi:hypothetical protein
MRRFNAYFDAKLKKKTSVMCTVIIKIITRGFHFLDAFDVDWSTPTVRVLFDS